LGRRLRLRAGSRLARYLNRSTMSAASGDELLEPAVHVGERAGDFPVDELGEIQNGHGFAV
jgi:hypothetical protein